MAKKKSKAWLAREIHKAVPRLTARAAQRIARDFGIGEVFGQGPLPQTGQEVRDRLAKRLRSYRALKVPRIPGFKFDAVDAENDSADELAFEAAAS